MFHPCTPHIRNDLPHDVRHWIVFFQKQAKNLPLLSVLQMKSDSHCLCVFVYVCVNVCVWGGGGGRCLCKCVCVWGGGGGSVCVCAYALHQFSYYDRSMVH